MNNMESKWGRNLARDEYGFVREAKKDCRMCGGKGVVRTVAKKDYEEMCALRERGLKEYEDLMYVANCRCCKVWIPADEYDKMHPSLGI